MGARSRSKGKRGEREVVALARAAGLAADRTWHTAQSADPLERACDVRIAGQPFQVKRRSNGFGELYDGVANVAGLFVRSDGRDWIAVVPAEALLRLLKLSHERPPQSQPTNQE